MKIIPSDTREHDQVLTREALQWWLRKASPEYKFEGPDMGCSSAVVMAFAGLFLCLIKWVSDSFWIWKGWYANVCANFWLCTLLKNWLELAEILAKGFSWWEHSKICGCLIQAKQGEVSLHFASGGCKRSARWQSDKFSLHDLTRFYRLCVEVGNFHYHFLDGEHTEILYEKDNKWHKNWSMFPSFASAL